MLSTYINLASKPGPDEIIASLKEEIQHLIQESEGFGLGTRTAQIRQAISQGRISPTGPDGRPIRSESLTQRELDRLAYEYYTRSAGEIERDVAANSSSIPNLFIRL